MRVRSEQTKGNFAGQTRFLLRLGSALHRRKSLRDAHMTKDFSVIRVLFFAGKGLAEKREGLIRATPLHHEIATSVHGGPGGGEKPGIGVRETAGRAGQFDCVSKIALGRVIMAFDLLQIAEAVKRLRAEVDAFMKKYPYMKVDYWRGTEIQIVQKTLAEQRSNNVLVDIIESVGVAASLARANAIIRDAINVDDFAPEELTPRQSMTPAAAA